MKKNLQTIGIVLIILSVIIVWGCYDLNKDPSPVYIPGRDTIKEWNDGMCELVGTPSVNEVRFLNQRISRSDNFAIAYKKVDHQIFFIMTRGEIVVNLETATYEIDESADSVCLKHSAIFDDRDSFVWLSEDE